MNKQTDKKTARLIADNRKARHDFTIQEHFEAGIQLHGWEVKSLRAGRAQLRDSYVILKHKEAWLLGTHISPLPTVSTHFEPDPQRSRKLLLNQRELNKLHVAVQRQGFTIVPLNLHWHKKFVKVEIALAKGKQTHDKRETLKRREWEREKQRTLKR